MAPVGPNQDIVMNAPENTSPGSETIRRARGTEMQAENKEKTREWCEVRVAARGTGAQHQHRGRKLRVDQEQREPGIFSDFLFMSTEKESIPMLAATFSFKIWKHCNDSTSEHGSDKIVE